MIKKLLFNMVPLLCSLPLMAHDLVGVLGPDGSSTDYFQVDCSNDQSGSGDSDRLEASIIGRTSKSPAISLQARGNDILSNTSDNIGGDKNASRTIMVADRVTNGRYFLTVNKVSSGITKYEIKYHCMGPRGHTGTQLSSVIQNQ
jgi:hypothetical protein